MQLCQKKQEGKITFPSWYVDQAFVFIIYCESVETDEDNYARMTP